MIFREMTRSEIDQIWGIDRREVIEHVYYRENGSLTLKPEHYDMQGWPQGEAAIYTPLLYAAFDRGGWLYGVFNDTTLIGCAVLDNKFLGKNKDQLQLKFLHVSRDYRKHGLGRKLFNLASEEALKRGAKQLYISATPSENTINFYLNLGATVTEELDPELYHLEPDDIHLVCNI